MIDRDNNRYTNPFKRDELRDRGNNIEDKKEQSSSSNEGSITVEHKRDALNQNGFNNLKDIIQNDKNENIVGNDTTNFKIDKSYNIDIKSSKEILNSDFKSNYVIDPTLTKVKNNDMFKIKKENIVEVKSEPQTSIKKTNFDKYLSIDPKLTRGDNKTKIKELLDDIDQPTRNSDQVSIKDTTKELANIAKESDVVNVKSSSGNTFVDRTITTIIELYDKIIVTKNEQYNTLKRENLFLKKTILDMQKYMNSDKRIIEDAHKQLKHSENKLNKLQDQYTNLSKSLNDKTKSSRHDI